MATDSMQKRHPPISRFKKIQKPMVDNLNGGFGKENIHPTLYPAPPPSSPFSLDLENFYQKPLGKHALLEAAPIKDARTAKKAKTDGTTLPPHDSFPPIVDDGQKPSHSYAQLIGMAILRAPNRRLTLSQIYKWISDTYTFYKANDAGWQNSIRHNLSLNKAFIKQERPKDDPGKGNYWAIEAGMEGQFMKEKPARRTVANSLENVHFMSSRPESIAMFHDGLSPLPPSILPAQPVMSSQATAPETTSALETADVSSDATIPLSDNGTPEESVDKAQEGEGNGGDSLYSPLPAAMHSSPPIPRHMEARSNTPPPISRAPASSTVRTHKRKFASMDSCLDDSGYISSLESSVMRPTQGSRGPTSEGERPRIKRCHAAEGRAENEIARIRHSSDSPTKGRSHGYPHSSSPLRQANESNQMLPPLTPAVKIRAPVKPPPSVSPNTNLRLHRDKVDHMLASPFRRVTGFNVGDDFASGTSVVGFDDNFYNFNDFLLHDSTDLDMFHDGSFASTMSFFDSAVISNGSPAKRPAKRMRMDRAHSTSVLGDITNSAANNKPMTSAPLLKVPDQTFPVPYDTPSKVFEGMSSPSRVFCQSPLGFKSSGAVKATENWMNAADDFGASHLFDEGSNVDILQGFERIGGNRPTDGSSRSSKPGLDRSYTTTF